MTEKKKPQPPDSAHLVLSCFAILLIYFQIQDYLSSGCFIVGRAGEICGEGVRWYIWIVVAFEFSMPILAAIRYYRWKRSEKYK